MKRLLPLIPTFGIFIVNSCQEEETLPTKEQVRFTVDITNDGTNNGRASNHFPDQVLAQISMSSSNGQSVLSNETITFTKTGDNYTSDLLTLSSGDYILTDFIVQNNTLEAIPTSHYNFEVRRGETEKISFGTAVRTKGAYSMEIKVYTEEEGKTKLTDATAYIFGEDGESFEYKLSAKANHIAFRGDPNASYSIEIRKAGYEPYINTFIYNQLEKKHLVVTLQEKSTEPEIAVTFKPSATYFSLWLQFTGTGTVTLDWGNGDVEVMDFDVDPEDATGTAYRFRDQTYATSIPPAKITGDIHLLVSIYFEGAVDAINTEYAVNLSELSFTDADIPLLNLSVNSELTFLAFNNATIGEMILPQQHAINFLSIQQSPFWPSAEHLDYIISNIYVNTVAANINNGSIFLNGSPVSGETATMLADLQNTYGWLITY